MDQLKKIACTLAVAASFGAVSLPAHAVTMPATTLAKTAQVRPIKPQAINYWHHHRRWHHHHHHSGIVVRL